MHFSEELRRFRERVGDRTVPALIIPGSGQAVTAALLIGALHPTRVAFLLTPESQQMPAAVAELLGVSAKPWECASDDHTDILQIYRSLRDLIERWSDLAREAIAVDLTGGTKPMSVGLAKAAYVLKIATLYIESDFTTDEATGKRVLIPGSQRLIPPPDPYLVFGDLEAAEGRRLYQSHDYLGAQRMFADLAARVQAEAREHYQAYAGLAAAYADWEAFDLRGARDGMQQLLHPTCPPALTANKLRLRTQLDSLNRLVDVAVRAGGRGRKARETLADLEDVLPLLGSLYGNARRREAQGRYDVAALLLYRCLELISQHRLATRGVLTEQPDFRHLLRQRPDLDADYRAVEEAIDLDPRGLPRPNRNGKISPIALFGGYILLAALNDPLVEGFPISQVRERSFARNKSILAHGYRLITEDEYREFASVVEPLLDRLFQINGRERASWEYDFTFVPLE
jgi:CRISPR-associated protein (TIGR02710 family)